MGGSSTIEHSIGRSNTYYCNNSGRPEGVQRKNFPTVCACNLTTDCELCTMKYIYYIALLQLLAIAGASASAASIERDCKAEVSVHVHCDLNRYAPSFEQQALH
jgi:hypothetical protein